MPLQRKRFHGGLRQQGSACRRAVYGMAEAMPLHFSVPEVSFPGDVKTVLLCSFTGVLDRLCCLPRTKQERALARVSKSRPGPALDPE
jgi:hypothetical protein